MGGSPGDVGAWIRSVIWSAKGIGLALSTKAPRMSVLSMPRSSPHLLAGVSLARLSYWLTARCESAAAKPLGGHGASLR